MAAVYITHLATVTSVSVPLGGMARTVNWKMHFPGHTRKRVTIVTVTVVAMENVYQVIMHSDRCQCDSGWHGTYCTQQYTSSGTTHCGNIYCVHGVCAHNSIYTSLFGFSYHCNCNHGWHGQHCDQQISTAKTTKKTTTSTTTTTTTTTTSTVAPTTTVPTTTSAPFTAAPIFYRCNHVSTIVAVAYQTPVSNPNASICAHGQQASHEAFVLTECDVPTTPATWKQGVNVMSRCASSNPIPYDTPIASFDHGLYSSAGSLSGVFLGCTSDGFKIAFQTCGQAPEMTELLQGHHFSQNPVNYFTIS
ncbi:uncharacterized protein LOC132721631 isoform X2 [Ruditapes philippinarum]|uniref:uncharacterized protein LOC132721631 isoform X2 n=1 Tax=Ruditapes philippinarum TaxID=129788 RepID=UPI00295BED99|nr:uncharacterized protein LOC132721631 isoform X2 [Ruditapes philippinarum]